MSVRIGRRIYENGSFIDPEIEGYTPILCLTKSSKYGSLSPYVLKDENNCLIENLWQFSKVYETVPHSIQKYSRFDQTVIWNHPEEIHYEDKQLTEEYWDWKQKGFSCKYPVRYPVGFDFRHKCLFSISLKSKPSKIKKLNYVEARKSIYLPCYVHALQEESLFKKLVKMFNNDKKLLIIEVDGPHQESLDHYQKKYDVSDTFIKNNTIKCNVKNMSIMLNDEKHPFGHGYCLGMAIMDIVNDVLEH
jgi:hypothetical protein